MMRLQSCAFAFLLVVLNRVTATIDFDFCVSFESAQSLSSNANASFSLILNAANFKLNGEFARDWKGDHFLGRKTVENNWALQYKLPNNVTHFATFNSTLTLDSLFSNLKGDTNHSAIWLFETSQWPWVNHRIMGNYSKQQIFKPNLAFSTDTLLEFAYGPLLSHLYKFTYTTDRKIEQTIPPISRPFRISKEEGRLVATDLNLNYGIQLNRNVSYGESVKLAYNLTGSDYSKQTLGSETHFQSKLDFEHNRVSEDTKLDVNVTYSGDEYAFHGELKKVRPRKYESKFSLEW